MFIFFVILHLIAALVLILVVLLQSGKAGDLASAFGGAGSQTAFGSRSAATLLTKATAVSAVVFMITSLTLSIMLLPGRSGTIMTDSPELDLGVPPAAIPAERRPEPEPVPPPDKPPSEQESSGQPAPEKPPQNQ